MKGFLPMKQKIFNFWKKVWSDLILKLSTFLMHAAFQIIKSIAFYFYIVSNPFYLPKIIDEHDGILAKYLSLGWKIHQIFNQPTNFKGCVYFTIL